MTEQVPQPRRRPRHRARGSVLVDLLDVARGRERRISFPGTKPQVTFDSTGRVVRIDRVSTSSPPPMGRRRAPGDAT